MNEAEIQEITVQARRILLNPGAIMSSLSINGVAETIVFLAKALVEVQASKDLDLLVAVKKTSDVVPPATHAEDLVKPARLSSH